MPSSVNSRRHRASPSQRATALVVLLLVLAAPLGRQLENLLPSDLEDVITIAPGAEEETPREERQQLAPITPALTNSALSVLPVLGWQFCCHGAAERAALKRGFPGRIDRPPTFA